MTILVVVVVFFCSKLVEFFHVAFISVEKHCPVYFLFLLGLFSFLRNNVCEKKNTYPRGIFLSNAKQIRNLLCFAEQQNQRSVTLGTC